MKCDRKEMNSADLEFPGMG